MNSVSEGILAVNLQAVITHINEFAAKIFSLEKEKVIGMRIEEVLQTEIPILETLKSGSAYRLKEVKIKKSGKQFHYLTSGVPILNSKGKIIGAVATIKEYKEVEEIILKMDSKKEMY